MTTRLASICDSCKHFHEEVPMSGDDTDHLQILIGYSRRTCNAYPDGIPEDIMYGGQDHRKPRGDEVDGITHEVDEREWVAGTLASYEKVTKKLIRQNS